MVEFTASMIKKIFIITTGDGGKLLTLANGVYPSGGEAGSKNNQLFLHRLYYYRYRFYL